jgi:hypothetical protein
LKPESFAVIGGDAGWWPVPVSWAPTRRGAAPCSGAGDWSINALPYHPEALCRISLPGTPKTSGVQERAHVRLGPASAWGRSPGYIMKRFLGVMALGTLLIVTP